MPWRFWLFEKRLSGYVQNRQVMRGEFCPPAHSGHVPDYSNGFVPRNKQENSAIMLK